MAKWPLRIALACALAFAAVAQEPLRVHPENPRYFTDGKRAVFLTGSHHWNNLQDSGRIGGPITNKFDFGDYLKKLADWNHNFIRLWAWEGSAYWHQGGENDNYYDPLPWRKVDGAKFDLDQFNEEYFKRLRERVIAARERGIYVGVMLFQGWSIYNHGYGNPWPGHPFNKINNVNGLNGDADGDGEGKEVHTLQVAAVTRRQEAYIRKVVDAVNDLDNVLFEVTNETALWSKEWQYHVVRFVHEYEKAKGKQHPVGMTAFDSGGAGSMEALFSSPADWISPQNDGVSGDYQEDPPATAGKKVILSDTDHLWGVGGDASWVWKSFTRGHQPIYMDPLKKEKWFAIDEAGMDGARRAMGHARWLAERVTLHKMVPRGDLASTKFCLANPSAEYVVFQPRSGVFEVTLPAGMYSLEWIHPIDGAAQKAEAEANASGPTRLSPPREGAVVLYAKKR